MFSPWDLAFPIGVGLLALGFCIWGFVRAENRVGKVVSLLTALAFLLPIPGVYITRTLSLKSDYVTSRGLRVRQGTKKQCLQEEVQAWENELILFWTHTYPKASLTIEDKLLVCKDEEKLSLPWLERFFRGYSTWEVATIGYRAGDSTYTRSLFFHEVSHLILTNSGIPYDEKTQHNIFQKEGLGY